MTKILSYESSRDVNEIREVEIPLPNNLSNYTVKARKFGKKILIETIADPKGQISTASDMVRETKLTVKEIKWLIEVAFL